MAALFALSALAGCVGGGDSSSTPSPAPAPAPGPVAGTSATCQLTNFETEALARVNALRASGAVCGAQGAFAATTPLTFNNTLNQAGLKHSDDMMSVNFFSHTGSDVSSSSQRATAAGYLWRAVGENIAAGQPTVASVMTAWTNSPGHCANLMNPSFTDIGLVCVQGSSGTTYSTYLTMMLGAQRETQ